MVRRKSVASLKSYCFKTIPGLITRHVRRCASKANAAEWFGKLQGDLEVDKTAMVKRQVDVLRSHIYSHIVWYDYETIFPLLLAAVEEAILITRRAWKPSSNITHYTHEMETMSEFADLAMWPYIQSLDMEDVSHALRTRVLGQVYTLTHLKKLTLRPPMFKSVSGVVTDCLEKLATLEQFSLKQDCNNAMVQAVTKHNWKSLKTLDIEGSKHVTDEVTDNLVQCQMLEEVNMFNTGLSDEAKGKMLATWPRLVRLPRGDFLCDALAWIEESDEDLVYLVSEFFPSQTYFFHEDWQIAMVAKCCPFISKMFFIYHEQCVPNYLVLEPFQYLVDLQVYGGNFYRDGLVDLLQIRGPALNRLSLVSVRQVDFKAFAVLSMCTKKLVSLEINQCNIVEYRPSGDPNSDQEYEKRQAFLAMAKEAFETVQTFPNVEHVVLNSPANPLYVDFLLSKCPNLKAVQLGSHTGITDDTVMRVLAANPMASLEEFLVERSSQLTMVTVHLLMEHCDQLRAIGDLQFWTAVEPGDLATLRQTVHEENLDLDTRSHQKLRKYLDMREFERKTYINLVAGPSLERIRMAERVAHAV